MKISQQTVIGFLIGLLIGGAAMYFVNDMRETTSSVTSNNTASTTGTGGNTANTSGTQTTGGTQTSGNAATPSIQGKGEYTVTAYDQPAGNMVDIIAHLPTDSWIAVHDDANGKLGNILGAGWFGSGVASGKVQLIRSTIPDTAYHVVIYHDNGNNTFDYHIDPVVTGEGDAPIQAVFRTTSGGASR